MVSINSVQASKISRCPSSSAPWTSLRSCPAEKTLPFDAKTTPCMFCRALICWTAQVSCCIAASDSAPLFAGLLSVTVAMVLCTVTSTYWDMSRLLWASHEPDGMFIVHCRLQVSASETYGVAHLVQRRRML